MIELELVAVETYGDPIVIRTFLDGLQGDAYYVEEIMISLQRLCRRNPGMVYSAHGLDALLAFIHTSEDAKLHTKADALDLVQILSNFVERPSPQSISVLTELLEHEEPRLREGALACFDTLVDRLASGTIPNS